MVLINKLYDFANHIEILRNLYESYHYQQSWAAAKDFDLKLHRVFLAGNFDVNKTNNAVRIASKQSFPTVMYNAKLR